LVSWGGKDDTCFFGFFYFYVTLLSRTSCKMLRPFLLRSKEEAGRVVNTTSRARLVRLVAEAQRLEERNGTNVMAALLAALLQQDRPSGEMGQTSHDLRENAPFSDFGFHSNDDVAEYRQRIRDTMIKGNRRSVYAALRRRFARQQTRFPDLPNRVEGLAPLFLLRDEDQEAISVVSNGVETDLEELITIFLNIVNPEHELGLREFDVGLFFFRLTHSAFAPRAPGSREPRPQEHERLPSVLFLSPASVLAFEEQQSDLQRKRALADVPSHLVSEVAHSAQAGHEEEEEEEGSLFPLHTHVELRHALASRLEMAQYDSSHVLRDWDEHADLLRVDAPFKALVSAYRSEDAPPAGLLMAATPLALRRAAGNTFLEATPPLYFYATYGLESSAAGIRERLALALDGLNQIKLLEQAQFVAPSGAAPLLIRSALPELDHVRKDRLWGLLDAAKRFAQINEVYFEDASVAPLVGLNQVTSPPLETTAPQSDYSRYVTYIEREMKESADSFNLELVRLDTAVAIFDAIVVAFSFLVDGTLTPRANKDDVRAELALVDVL
jgi:hypothetical protein